tara:strand:- start:2059 stop:2370 length:312 start_codon:yes stop_codon:yes gene_type:complete
MISIFWKRIKEILTGKYHPEKEVPIDEKKFKELNTKKKNGNYVKICPKCGSLNIKIDFSKPEIWAIGSPSLYNCKDCNYKFYNFPEIEKSEVEEFREKLKEKE